MARGEAPACFPRRVVVGLLGVDLQVAVVRRSAHHALALAYPAGAQHLLLLRPLRNRVLHEQLQSTTAMTELAGLVSRAEVVAAAVGGARLVARCGSCQRRDGRHGDGRHGAQSRFRRRGLAREGKPWEWKKLRCCEAMAVSALDWRELEDILEDLQRVSRCTVPACLLLRLWLCRVRGDFSSL